MIDITLRHVDQARDRIGRYLWPTPMRSSQWLNEILGGEIFLKPENLQRTGSFKVRGGFNRVLELADQGSDRVITASAGNHGQGVALAAKTLGMRVTVVVPENASPVKVAALRRLGAEVSLQGRDYDEAEAAMLKLADAEGVPVASPYDPAVIAGQGTVALEMLDEIPDLDMLLVPVGAGGLIAGCAVAAKGIKPDIRIVGVQASASPSMVAALDQGKIVPVAVGDTLADGLAGNIAGGELPFGIIQRLVERVELVEESQIAQAIRVLVAEERLVVEGSGAVGIAALTSGRVQVPEMRVGVVLSGGNIAYEILFAALSGAFEF